MKQAALIQALEAHQLEQSQMPTGEQMRFVRRFVALYDKHGLLHDGAAPALRICCINGPHCWREAQDRRWNVNKGGITLPWVGPDYRAGGVLVLGMNFNNAEGIAMAFRLANWERTAFGKGKKQMKYDTPGYRGSAFAYRSTRSAGLLADIVNGIRPRDRREPEELAAVLNNVVRLQTVKCSPRNDAWSKPTTAMWDRCAPMLLPHELSIARPRFLVAFGQQARHALERLPGFNPQSHGAHLHVGQLTTTGTQTGVFVLAHPRSTQWPASHESLKRYLRQHATQL